MRDHKIALFKAKEDDLVAEIAEKDFQLEELEVSPSTYPFWPFCSQFAGIACGGQYLSSPSTCC